MVEWASTTCRAHGRGIPLEATRSRCPTSHPAHAQERDEWLPRQPGSHRHHSNGFWWGMPMHALCQNISVTNDRSRRVLVGIQNHQAISHRIWCSFLFFSSYRGCVCRRCGESSPIRGFLFGAEGCPPALHHVLHRLRRLGACGRWILPSPCFGR